LVDLAPRMLATAGATGAAFALGRRGVFLWVCAIILLNELASGLRDGLSASPGELLSDLGAVGVFQLMAWFAVFYHLARSDPARAAQRRDFLVAVALSCLIFVPSPLIIWVAALGLGVYGWLANGGDRRLRAASTVLAALSIQEFWGKIVFKMFALPLLRAETAVVGTALQAVRPGTVWQDNVITGPDGHGIVVYDLCSSFHNLSLAALCWVTVRSFQDRPWQARDFAFGGVVCATMVAFNVVRLCLMAWNAELYEYWHLGPGYQIFGVGAAATILVISLYGSRAHGA